MNKTLTICVFLAALVLPATARAEEQINLSEYKTVAVQPVLDAGNSRSLFASRIAAQTSLLTALPQAAQKFSEFSLAGDDAGFGFAGKAKQKQILILGAAASFGMLPSMMKLQPESTAETIVKLRGFLEIMKGEVSPDVIKMLDFALTAASSNDAQTTAKSILMAMGAAADSIGKGSERTHGYVATGIYTGFATIFAVTGSPNTNYADMAAPLVMLLEEDAAMGGADRAVAVQLKLVAESLRTAKPPLDGIMSSMTAMISVTPDK